MALPVFKTGLSMQVDRWVRLPPSPAISLEVDGSHATTAHGEFLKDSCHAETRPTTPVRAKLKDVKNASVS